MRKLILASLLSLCGVAMAAGTGAEDLRQKLQTQYPNTAITSVRESVLPGLYEVVLGRNVAYTNADGRYMLFGHVFDMKTREDLTAGVIEELNRVDVAQLPIVDAVKTVRGKGSRVLYVFSDPDCPFCKKLEQELGKVDDVTIYTFLYPLEGLHPDAKRKSKMVWCAKDRAKAWSDLMIRDQLPKGTEQCATPVERSIALGEKLGFKGTPTLIFKDGQIAPGALPASEIEKRLAAKN